MPKSFVIISPKFQTFFVSICVILLVSCQSAADKETAQLKQDAPSSAEISRLNQVVNSSQTIMQSDIDALQKIREKYPHAPVVRQVLQAALIKREDWAAAADLIGGIPEAQRTAEEKSNLAKIYLKTGRYADALQTVTPLLEKNPADLELVSISSGALFYLGRYDEAGKQLDSVWPQILNGRKADETTLRGMICFYQKDYAKAAETLNKAIEFSPDNIAAYNGLTRVYAAQGETAKAEESTKKVEELYRKMTANERRKTKFARLVYELEDAYKAKRFAEVVQIAQRMLPEAEGASKIAVYQYLANAYQALGKTEEANRAAQEAEKLKNQK